MTSSSNGTILGGLRCSQHINRVRLYSDFFLTVNAQQKVGIVTLQRSKKDKPDVVVANSITLKRQTEVVA